MSVGVTSALLFLATLISGAGVGSAASIHSGAGATYVCGPDYSHSYTCLKGSGYSGQPVWGADRGHNCTAYAAYRLRQNGSPEPWPSPLGNAVDWKAKAQGAGYRVDGSPAVGSIAWWGGEKAGGLGHVAYVESATSSSIILTEDAYYPNRHSNGYDDRSKITRGTSAWPDAFLHIKDVTDLFFVKTKNVGSGHVEVHSATAASNYQRAGQHSVTYFSPADANNGWFQMVGRDLYFVKTKNVGSGHVEVHSATAASNYQRAGQHSVTYFSPADANNGWFEMEGSDLFFVKTKNVGSGHVEVHSATATAASSYQTGIHSTTYLSPGDANNGWFNVGNKA